MDISAAAPASIPAAGHETTTAALDRQENDRVATKQTSASPTRDFHLDTFFNPVWMAGPHVFSFADNGTVVCPETYASEPYPGYRAPRLELAGVLNFYRFCGITTELRNDVAGEEKEVADSEEVRERARALAELAEWRRWLPYGSGAFQMPDPGLVYTWPPK